MDSLLIFLLDKSGSMGDTSYGYGSPSYTTPTNENLPSKVLAIMRDTAKARGLDWDKLDDSRRKGIWGDGQVEIFAKYGYRRGGTLLSSSVMGTIDAFNHFLRVMQYREDQCSFFMAQFHSYQVHSGTDALGQDSREITHPFVSLFDAAPLDETTYQTGNGTALYNAIGYTLQDVDKLIDSLPDNEKPTKVTFVIQTDGEDRHSGWLDAPQARELLDKKRLNGWDTLFLAAGSSAEKTGRALGFTKKTMLTYSMNGGSAEAFDTAANAVLESLVTGRLEV